MAMYDVLYDFVAGHVYCLIYVAGHWSRLTIPVTWTSYMSGGGPEWSIIMLAVSRSSTGNLAFKARTCNIKP
jgi:hypothetical protein